MDKVICDICGTSFSVTEDCCPICGCSRDMKLEPDTELEEDFLQDSPITSARKVDGKYKAFNEAMIREAVSEDEDDEEPDEDDDEDEDDGEEEDSRRGRTGTVILLTVVIMLLLSVCGFLAVRYLLPNLLPQPETVQTEPSTEAPVETTTEPGIPCQQLVLMSGAALDLSREGEYRLINVIVKPEDSTDTLEYFSADETVATVNSEGRVTAVGEGDTVITVICGTQKVQCRVFVHYVQETEPPTQETTEPEQTEEETVPEETAETTEAAEATEATETAEATEATEASSSQLKDVTLKLGKNDFSMGVGYEYTIPLDCELEYGEIEWSTGNAAVATIEDGVITTHGPGTTQMFARYGDQEVTGWIRVK